MRCHADGRPIERFIENVHHAHQARPDLAGEANPLRLATRQRLGTAVQAKIIESHVDQKAVAGAQLFEKFYRQFLPCLPGRSNWSK